MQPVLIVKAWQYETEVVFPTILGIGGSFTAIGGTETTKTVELSFLTQVLPILMLLCGCVGICCRVLLGMRTAYGYPRIHKVSPRGSGNAPATTPTEDTLLLEQDFVMSDAASPPAQAPVPACQPSKAQATETIVNLPTYDTELQSSLSDQQDEEPAAPIPATTMTRVTPSPAAALRAEINKAFAPNAPLPAHLQVGSSIPYNRKPGRTSACGSGGSSSAGSPSGGATCSFGQYTSSLGPYGYVPPEQRSPQQTSPIPVKVRASPSPPIPPSPPLDLRGLSRMEDFLAEAGAGAPQPSGDLGSGRGLVNSARRFAKNITERVLPKKGFVKGVAERWTEAHLTPPQPPRTVSGFEPYSPEKLSISKLNMGDIEHSPERVGPSSFERRRRLIETQMLNA